jgi:phosphoribosylaminoimidazolecarboxamide formyltransferase/IMP cyclohydrolase
MEQGGVSLKTRRRLAAKTYARTAAYDAAISEWYWKQIGEDAGEWRAFGGKLQQTLRYGENPHQKAVVYAGPDKRAGVLTARQVQGKGLSYNNLNDADGALDLIAEWRDAGPACAIIKHANPCGVATGTTLAEAYEKAFQCDPVSAFGGIIAVNQPLDGPTAEAITGIFTEVVIAPGADEDALKVFAGKKNLRLLIAELPDPRRPGLMLKPISGGMLVQSRDNGAVLRAGCQVVTQRTPTDAEWVDLMFAWTVARHVKSNAIVFCKDGMTMGVGAGQMSRLDSARIASIKAGHANLSLQGTAVASDAFFPFRDGLDVVVDAGASCVIQPGGSMRDQEVIDAANERGVVMVLSGVRHFRH